MLLNINKVREGNTVTLKLEGKLNSVTSQDFKDKVLENINDCDELVLDFSNLHYVASAGLRVILEAHKTLVSNGKKLTICNVDAGIQDILKATGLSKFLIVK